MIRKSMSGLLLIGFVSTLLLFTSACQQKKPPVPVTEQPAAVEQTKPDTSAEDEAKRRAQEEAARLEAERAAAKAAMESEKIYFDYDKADLSSASQSILTKKANCSRKMAAINSRLKAIAMKEQHRVQHGPGARRQRRAKYISNAA
jgi:outer membrane protein OmpA-like peptidoglycan-associated protein